MPVMLLRLRNLLPWLVAAAFVVTPQLARSESVLITGSSTGIGLEFAKQYAARGWTVYATHHFPVTPRSLLELHAKYPLRVHIELLDVTRADHVTALSAKLRGKPIDVLLNNAAIKRVAPIRDREGNKGQDFGSFDFDQFDQFIHVNTAGPLRVVQGFIDNVRISKQKKLVTISSGAGTISVLPNAATDYWYRISKSALNQGMRLLSVELRNEGIIAVMFQPGGVEVESFQGPGIPGLIPTPVAVGRMVKVIDGLTMNDSGRFLTNDGKDQPW
jgi:NAD(P)-dependent dehydrogenase (short-subunit alcohol dehydrogenase family)